MTILSTFSFFNRMSVVNISVPQWLRWFYQLTLFAAAELQART